MPEGLRRKWPKQTSILLLTTLRGLKQRTFMNGGLLFTAPRFCLGKRVFFLGITFSSDDPFQAAQVLSAPESMQQLQSRLDRRKGFAVC